MADLDQIKQKALPLLKKAGVTRSALFGSYVRGEQREDSDIDFLVEFPPGTSLFDIGGLLVDLENALGKKVDLVSYKTIKPQIKNSILSSQVSIL